MRERGIVIDRARNTIRIERVYPAPVARVWWAWTDPEPLTKWWGPAGWEATVYEMDVRPGGRWRFQLAPTDGSAAPVRGVATYSAVDPLVLLAYEDAFADEDWQPDGTGTFPTTVVFASDEARCRIAVEASFPDGEALERAVDLHMADGYVEALDRLANLLESERG